MKIRDENRIPELIHELEYLANHKIEIGMLSGEVRSEVLMIATVHEYGVTTDKVNIPERSFIRAGFDENVDDIDKAAKTLLDGVLRGRTTGEAMLEALGGMITSKLQEYATDLSEPPNHPVTIERKGSSNPLKDSGEMIDKINWRVVST